MKINENKLNNIIDEINTITAVCDGDGNGACLSDSDSLYDLLRDEYPILTNLITNYLKSED